MASTETQQIIQAIQELGNTLKRNSSSAGGSAAGSGFYSGGSYGDDTQAKKRLELARKGLEENMTLTANTFDKLKKELDKGSASVTQTYKAITVSTQDSLESLFNNIKKSSDLDEIPKKFKSQFEALGGNLTHSITSFDDIQKVVSETGDKVARYGKAMELRDKARAALDNNNRVEAEEYSKQIKELGFKTEELSEDTLEEYKNQHDAAAKSVAQLSDSSKTSADNFMNATNKVIGALAQIGGAALATAKPSVDLIKQSMAAGVDVNYMAFQYGLSTEALIASQKESIQMIRASGMSFDQFNERIHAGAEGLLAYAGGTEEATRVAMQSAQMAQTLADNDAQRATFENEQFNRFRRLNKVLSMSAEEFVAMNEQLSNSHEVQTALFRLDKSKRAAFMTDLQNTYEKIRIDGLSHEQALKMLDVLTEIGGKSAKDRLKDAAKLQATMGAMGLGAEGAEAAALLRGGLRNEGDKERFAELMKMANMSASDTMARSFEGEMMIQEMLAKTGTEQYIGEKSEFSKLETMQQNALDEQKYTTEAARAIQKTNETKFDSLIGGYDNLTTAMTGPLAQSIAGGFGLISSLMGGVINVLLAGMLMQTAGVVGGLKTIVGAPLGWISKAASGIWGGVRAVLRGVTSLGPWIVRGLASMIGWIGPAVMAGLGWLGGILASVGTAIMGGLAAITLPIWGIIAGIAAVGGLIWYFWDDLVQVVDDSIAWLGDKFTALADWWENFSFSDALSDFGNSVVGGISDAIDFATAPLNWISDGIDGIADWWENFSFSDALSGVGDSIVSGIGAYFDVLMTPINLINDGIHGIKTWWENFSFADAISGIIPDWMKDGSAVAGAVAGAVADGAGAIVDGAVAAADVVGGFVGDVADGVGSAVDAAGDLAGDAWSGVKSFFSEDADPSKQIEAVAKLLADSKDETAKSTAATNEVVAKLQSMLEEDRLSTSAMVAVLGQISKLLQEQTEMLAEQYEESISETRSGNEKQVRALRRFGMGGSIS